MCCDQFDKMNYLILLVSEYIRIFEKSIDFDINFLNQKRALAEAGVTAAHVTRQFGGME